MSTAETRKISIDEVVEAAASGVLRALDARHAAAAGTRPGTTFSAAELVKSGFFVDLVIRAGGFPGPIDIRGSSAIGGSLAGGQ